MSKNMNPTLLVIDDEADIREMIGDALGAEGFDIISAASAAEADGQLAGNCEIDLAITDLSLPDSSGSEIITRLRKARENMPTIVITGKGAVSDAADACRMGCADFLTKPLDLDALKEAIRRELQRKYENEDKADREIKLREIVHKLNKDRHRVQNRLDTTCAALTQAYRTLNKQFIRQESVLRMHRRLLTCQNDDDIFRTLFNMFSERMGAIFGAAMVCDENAELQMVGRFGTPSPDSVSICQGYAFSLLDLVLQEPEITRVSPKDHLGIFPQWLHQHIDGSQFMCIPLLPREGQLIGLVVLYHKNGLEFTDEDVSLAAMLAPSVAISVQAADSSH